MITALVIIGMLAMVLTFACTVAVAVLVSKALERAFLSIERMSVRHSEHLEKVLDRLMTVKWEDFAALRATIEVEEEGGFIPPEEEGGVTVPNVFGVPISLRAQDEDDVEEAKLLQEDFDFDTGDRRR